MRQLLKPHPNSGRFAAVEIEVGVARSRVGSLMLSYTVTGNLSGVRIPPVAKPARSDELWRYTCFEAFVRASSGIEYYELNFAPSTQWAAYRFSGYRSGLCEATEIGAPQIEVQSTPDCYTLQASFDPDRLSGLPRKDLWRLGLSAVIEDASGSKSYWALAHPPGEPDFHHADCFAYEFSPAVPS
jgi:hypothetical protein